jgi:hypothetical protein
MGPRLKKIKDSLSYRRHLKEAEKDPVYQEELRKLMGGGESSAVEPSSQADSVALEETQRSKKTAPKILNWVSVDKVNIDYSIQYRKLFEDSIPYRKIMLARARGLIVIAMCGAVLFFILPKQTQAPYLIHVETSTQPISTASTFDYAYSIVPLSSTPFIGQPSMIFNDGRKTYIKFPIKDELLSPPLLFETTSPSGTPLLINYRIKDSFIILDRVVMSFTINVGNAMLAVTHK